MRYTQTIIKNFIDLWGKMLKNNISSELNCEKLTFRSESIMELRFKTKRYKFKFNNRGKQIYNFF